jgi:hypothetical protein
VLFTNSFPKLTNRVEDLRARLRPEIARLGTNAVAQFDRAVADLQQRISLRLAHLRRHLFAPAPELSAVAPGGEMAVTNWLWSVEHGKAALRELQIGNGKLPNEKLAGMLEVRLEPRTEEAAVATWEARVLLPKGAYRFATTVACEENIFRGADWPVELKIWGGSEQQSESSRTDAQHVELSQTFSITSDAAEEILIQCQARSREMNLLFQFGSLVLTRIE